MSAVRKRGVIVAIIIFALCGLGLSCVTPVIPLPPPPLTDMSFAITGTSNDMIVLSCKPTGGAAHGGHYVFVLNDTAKKITMALANKDGSFTTDPLPAHDGDQVWIWASAAPGEEGDTVCGRLRFATGTLSADCTY
jgi:hypothetical protein